MNEFRYPEKKMQKPWKRNKLHDTFIDQSTEKTTTEKQRGETNKVDQEGNFKIVDRIPSPMFNIMTLKSVYQELADWHKRGGKKQGKDTKYKLAWFVSWDKTLA